MKRFSPFLFSFFVSLSLFASCFAPVASAQSDVYVEIVFDLSGSMADEMVLEEEQDLLSFITQALANEEIDAFGALDEFVIPEIEIPEFVAPEIESFDELDDIGIELNNVLDDVNTLVQPMYQELGYVTRIDVAREALRKHLSQLNPNVQLAFRTFGTSCGVSDLLIDFAAGNADEIITKADKLRPFGDTPLAYAISQARLDLEKKAGFRKMIIITDGEESCGGDMIEEANKLKDISLEADLIYFGGDEIYGTDLQEFAEIVGGSFVNATSVDELNDALDESLSEASGIIWYYLYLYRILFLLFLVILYVRCRSCCHGKGKW